MTQKKLKKRQRRQRRKARKRQARQRLEAAASDSFVGVDEDASVELKAAEAGEDGQPRIRRFEMTAYNGGRLFVNRFPHPAVVDLSTLNARRQSFPSHLDHKKDQRVGHTTRLSIEDNKIRAEGVISAANAHAEEVVKSGDNGFPWQSSIGVRFDQSNVSFVRAGAKTTVNGRTFAGPVFVVRNGTLNEISFVSVGGDEEGADARIAASAVSPEGEEDMNFQQWLEAKGFDVDTLTAKQKEFFQAQYDRYAEWLEANHFDVDTLTAEQNTSLTTLFEASLREADEPVEPPDASQGGQGGDPNTNTNTNLNAGGGDGNDLEAQLAEERRVRAAEVTRVNEIRTLCAEHNDPTFRVQGRDISLEAHAIEQGWDTNRVELEILRSSRGSASIQAHSHAGSCTLEAMQGAAMLAGGVPLDWEGFGSLQAQALRLPNWAARGINDDTRQRIMEAAHRFSEMSSLDICREAVRLDGRMVPSGRSSLIEAAFSGSNLLNIWTTNVNARLLMKFMETPDTTRGWTQEADVPDFRLNERPRVEKGGRLTKHARGKSAEHHSGSDTEEEYRIARYSNQIFRDEMDVIDDRLMAGQQVIDEMALAAARLRPDLVYAILMGNPNMKDGTPLFDASRNNLDDVGALLDETHLKEAITRMWLQQENGVNLNLTPTHLVTAATLNFDALQELRSTERRAPSADGGPTMNSLQNAVANIVSDSRIDNGVVDPDSGNTIAGDATAFFVVSTMAPTIEVGYRRGTGRAPSVTTWRKNGEDGQWGVGASVKMDIGAAATAFQGMQKLTD